MKLTLGTFARSGIEAQLGGDIAAGVRAALRHYTQCSESGLGPPPLPRFRHEQRPALFGADLELAVEPEVQKALEHEARESQGVTVEQLATHAVLFYLADLDKVSAVEARPLTHL